MKKIILDEAQIVSDYLSGQSSKDISITNKCSPQTILRILSTNNITIRDIKTACNMPLRSVKIKQNTCRQYSFTREDLTRLYWDEGKSQNTIAKIFHCTQKVIRHRLHLWGIPKRTKNESYNSPLRLKAIGDVWRGKGFMKGKKFSDEHRKKLSKSKEKHWASILATDERIRSEYTTEFNELLKEKVRERDGYLCQLCYIPQNGTRHPVHHIDYIKNHNDINNLITLCHKCHRRTNGRRDYWEKYFKELLDKPLET